MRTWLWVSLALGLIVALVALAPASIRIRWRLEDGRQRLAADLGMAFGLIHIHRELPPLRLKKLLFRYRSPGPQRRVKRSKRWAHRVTPVQGMLAAQALKGRLQVRQLRLSLSLGTGDAAGTALAYGGAWAAVGTALATSRAYLDYQHQPEIDIRPDFDRRRLAAAGDCILALRMADIMRAAWRLVRH